MSKYDINKAYVSLYDKFLDKFDKKHTPSLSQIKEIEKHRRIAYLRDNIAPPVVEEIWEEF